MKPYEGTSIVSIHTSELFPSLSHTVQPKLGLSYSYTVAKRGSRHLFQNPNALQNMADAKYKRLASRFTTRASKLLSLIDSSVQIHDDVYGRD